MSKDKSVLVIGGAGFIGSHTVLALVNAGYRPVVYDNLTKGHKDAVFGDKFIEGDLADRELLEKVMRQEQITSVIHFAALIEAGASVTHPLEYFRNNVASTVSLLEAMRNTGVKNIVFSSTAAVYGNVNADQPLVESLPHAPINPYGDSKSMVERMLERASYTHEINAIALRYFNAAGADPEGRTGERHSPETHLIPLIIQAALGQRKDITIFGQDYDTPDGTCIRDYIHVCDLAQGHLAALQHLEASSKRGFEAINLGTGLGYSVREVVEKVEQIVGQDIPKVFGARREGDPARLVANVSKSNSLLGWKANQSDLTNIVKDAWNYFSKLHNLK